MPTMQNLGVQLVAIPDPRGQRKEQGGGENKIGILIGIRLLKGKGKFSME